ncbi:MAG: hypothetical protein II350_08300 [Clostridia bacterium]|nr:hypothetical protein [Clostridia bacterium]
MENWTFKNSFFYREIRRVNISRLVFSLLVLAVIVFLDTRHTVVLAAAKFRPAAAVTPAEIAAITSPETQLTQFSFSANYEKSKAFEADYRLKRLMYEKDGSCRLVLTPDEILSANYEAMEESGKVSASVEYVYARLGDKYLIVKRHVLKPTDVLTGTIGYLPSDIRLAITADGEIPEGDVLPLIMDTTGDAFASLTTDILFSAFLFVIWGIWFFGIVRRAVKLDRDPAYKRLFTCAGTIEENALAIDKELQGRTDFGLFGNIVTENWHIRRRPLSFMVEPRTSYIDG